MSSKSSPPVTLHSEILRKREKEHNVKFDNFEFKEKLLLDEGARDDSDLRISYFLLPHLSPLPFTFHPVINFPKILEGCAISVLNTLSLVECVVNFYESPQTHSRHL